MFCNQICKSYPITLYNFMEKVCYHDVWNTINALSESIDAHFVTGGLNWRSCVNNEHSIVFSSEFQCAWCHSLLIKCSVWSPAAQGKGKLFLLLCVSLPLWTPPPRPLALPLVLSLQYSQPRHVYWRVHMAVACEVGRDLKTRNRKHFTHFSLSLTISLCTVLTLQHINNWLGLNADCVVPFSTEITCQTKPKPPCHCCETDSSNNSRLLSSVHPFFSNPPALLVIFSLVSAPNF